MQHMSLLGFAACSPDATLRDKLPFPCAEIKRDSIPLAMRRRSSQAMQVAFSTASMACAQAERDPAQLPTLFASVAGEIQTTDQLCHELVKVDGIVSPSAFHNSVQNTVAGYWSIAHHCLEPASALAAGRNTVAMALLETWSQLAVRGGELLLVCYDEIWPAYLAPGMGQSGLAYALLFAADCKPSSLARLGKPQRQSLAGKQPTLAEFSNLPILEIAPLLSIVTSATRFQPATISLGSEWSVALDNELFSAL